MLKIISHVFVLVISVLTGSNFVMARSSGVDSKEQNIFVGGNNNLSAYANVDNVRNLLDTNRVSVYISVIALKKLVSGPADGLNPAGSIGMAEKVLETFSTKSPPILEEFYDSYATPSLPKARHNDGGAVNDFNGPQITHDLKLYPKIVTMNINTSRVRQGEPSLSEADSADWRVAVSDIHRQYPSVSYVYPFIRSDADTDWSRPDDSMKAVEALIKSAGGVGIDIPAGFLLGSKLRISSVISEIKWANANGIVTLLYVTPFAAKPPPGVIAQQAQDSDFLTNTQIIVNILKNSDALPSGWVIGNYSPVRTIAGRLVTGNPVGEDSDVVNSSITAVGLWLARSAPISSVVPIPTVR